MLIPVTANTPSIFFPGSGFLIFVQGVFLNRKLRLTTTCKKTMGGKIQILGFFFFFFFSHKWISGYIFVT